MAAASHFDSELPREVAKRLRHQFERPDWGRAHLVTLTLEELQIPTPVMYEIGKTIVAEHERTLLVMIGSVLPDKIHILLRSGCLTPGRYKRFEDAFRDLREAITANAMRALRRPGTLLSDTRFVRPIETETEIMQIGLRIWKASITAGICQDPARYPHLLLP